MFRHCMVLLMGLCTVGPVSAATWADALFEELSKDFGSVPRGPMLTHPFRLTNNTGATVRISSMRISCGCVTATALQGEIPPGGSTVVMVQMDTRRFTGVKNVTIFVEITQPKVEEVRLWVQANSRDDVMVTPDSLAFGVVKRGGTPATTVTVNFLGNGQWAITSATCDSNYVQTSVKEIKRDLTEVSYQVSAQLRSDAPVGRWYSDVWLNTNNPLTPRIRVPLTVEIESALTISPATVVMGKVKAGTQVERKVIVRGVRPFRITGFKGVDEFLTVQDSTTGSMPIHVLTVILRSDKAGELDRTLRVTTDLPEEAEIEFHAKAEIVP